MGTRSRNARAFLSFPLLLYLLTIPSECATDTLIQSQPISVGQTLISAGKVFELGFFSPGNSGKRYIGLWNKNITVRKIVWVANRENPLPATDSASSLVIGSGGNLRLLDGMRKTFWSTNVSLPSNKTVAVLLDKGLNTKTGEKHFLSSWETDNDPSPRTLVLGLTPETPPQLFLWNSSKPYWRSGPWDGWTFIGTLKTMNWDEEKNDWFVSWMAVVNPCDIYGVCGPFGVCSNKNGSPICECLKGFVPKSTEDWSKGNWTGGCVRRTELLCQKNISSLANETAQNDGFWKLSGLKLPDHFEYLFNKDYSGCQQWCVSNCSCVAYAYVTGIACMVWAGDLVDVQQFSIGGKDLFLRLANSEMAIDHKKRETNTIIFTTISGVILVGAFMFGLHRWRAKRVKRKNRMKHYDVADRKDTLQDHVIHGEPSELPMIDFDKITVATNNFSQTNKLGEGGFGPGKLEDGQEVAVQRLSRHSGQGTEEFKNEILLISKLQHRNLVRLLGCCIEGEEKLLVYEYMTNKSLDMCLFDETKRVQLDWAKHFHIIQGIARGILYLHRDSCLRVIHGQQYSLG
ncbi:hypothetical protein ACSBR1_016212 [Camellia fascicularis]